MNDPQRLNYQQSPNRTGVRGRNAKQLAIAASAFLCLTPAGLAACAWLTHWSQLRRNAVPMVPLTAGMIAKDLTYVTFVCVVAVGLAWGIGWRWPRRRKIR